VEEIVEDVVGDAVVVLVVVLTGEGEHEVHSFLPQIPFSFTPVA
jgi:hypothetical protein